jgi:hypothetical protein
MKTLALFTFLTFSAWAQTTEPGKKAATKQPAPVEAKPSDTVIGEGSKACVPGDNSPAGTVADGYKKVIEATPFGNACRWIAIK